MPIRRYRHLRPSRESSRKGLFFTKNQNATDSFFKAQPVTSSPKGKVGIQRTAGEQEDELKAKLRIQRVSEEDELKAKGADEELKGKGGSHSFSSLTSGLAIQRNGGKAKDLSSPRFKGNKPLENALDNLVTIKNGSKGTHVKLLQEALVALGYELPQYGVDSDFGSETEAAIRAFQRDTGAKSIDGKVGPETMGILDKRDQGQELAPAATPVTQATPLNMDNVIAQPGATPIHVPRSTWPASRYGFTDTETVTINFTPVNDGTHWRPVVTGLIGNYSLEARLLAGQSEVDPNASNSTSANYCDQVRELKALGFFPPTPTLWYMRSAVVAHERVHGEKMRPALVAAAPAIETSIESLKIPASATSSATAARFLFLINPAFLAAVANARTLWDAQYVALISGDHSGPAAAAEHKIVDPVVKKICNKAKANKWPACAAC